jgi:hypothetical protein
MVYECLNFAYKQIYFVLLFVLVLTVVKKLEPADIVSTILKEIKDLISRELTAASMNMAFSLLLFFAFVVIHVSSILEIFVSAGKSDGYLTLVEFIFLFAFFVTSLLIVKTNK